MFPLKEAFLSILPSVFGGMFTLWLTF